MTAATMATAVNRSALGYKRNDMSSFASAKPIRRQFVHNALVMWLDETNDQANNDVCNSLAQLRRNANNVETFMDVDEFVDSLTELTDVNVIMIVSAVLGEKLLTFIHDVPSLNVVFILSHDDERDE
jgi:hypothetical protein